MLLGKPLGCFLLSSLVLSLPAWPLSAQQFDFLIARVDLKIVDLGSSVRVEVVTTLSLTEIHRLSRIECDGSGNYHLGSLNQSFATNGLPKDQVITLSNPRPIRGSYVLRFYCSQVF